VIPLRDIVLDQIRHRQTPVVPYTLPFDKEVAERVDAHYGNGDWRNRIKPYIVYCGAVDTDWKEKIAPGKVRDAYGGIWRTDMRPWHLETPPLAEPTFDGYAFPKAEAFYRPEWKAKARETIAANKGSFIVANLGWGLFERSWNLRGYENALMDALAEPDFFAEMLERLMELYLEFVRYTVDLPADAILFGDDWGDQRGVTIGPDRWRRLIKPRWAKIYEEVHRAGKLVMHHTCGSVVEILPDIIEIGVDVLESCQPEAVGMNPYELKKRWGDKITFWGCLGSQSLIPHGTPEQLKEEIRRLRREMGRGGGYILAPAKPLQPETPVANAVAILDAFTEKDA
jgi:uroporphyrinogen decarboxylase